jgi:hypothetical protein
METEQPEIFDENTFPKLTTPLRAGDRVEISKLVLRRHQHISRYGTILAVDVPGTCGGCGTFVCKGHTKILLDDGTILCECFGYSPGFGLRVIKSDFITDWDDAK